MKENTGKKGKVYLIGAGPGDPGLLTLRGKSVLEKADVVVYDRLVSPAILGFCNPKAKMVDVGKMPTHHKVKQSEINKLLVQFASEFPGGVIARLKGGDPFVFGRGGEEALELVAAGVEFEVVPGITSAISVPAYAGIPVSHRGIATSFHIITGHEKLDERRETRDERACQVIEPTETRDERACQVIEPAEMSCASDRLSLDFEAIARCPGTLIFLMGIANMDFIARRLMECGKDPKTPLAFIEKGTTPYQRTVMATLQTAGETIVRENVTAPAITIMGGVVELGKTLAWKKNLPLSGKRLVVTRAAKQASGITARLTALGAEVIETPMIETRTLECPLVMAQAHDSIGSAMPVCEQPVTALASHVIASPEGARQSRPADFSSLANFDILAFTSTNGVESFFKQLLASGNDIRILAGKKIASVGKITEKKLLEYGIRCDYVPEDHTGEGLGKLLRSILDERTLVNSLQTKDERGSTNSQTLASSLSLSKGTEFTNLDESRILLLQGNLADDTLLKLLPQATRWVVYETLPVVELPEWKREAVESADAVVFASTSAVENFVKRMPQSTPSMKLRVNSRATSCLEAPQTRPRTSFCIGRMTESAARKHGFETVTSDETTMDSLVKKIVEYYTTSPNH
ncbi:uroporphyrinogen-III C-methyltransferase [Fibrobacter sp.]|uniref:uroporphyrinogen-III C-methyltransferase n=1 Tax=Fibrobacter sp. TaxID=35828 RepID=UPI0025BA6B9E|nr:uroporphyrinogen-III C-methyltransferase [Fibrobacter sp.]